MAEEPSDLKPCYFVGSSRKEINGFPQSVREDIGFAIFTAQLGGKHRSAKSLKGFGGAGVLEIVKNYHGDTWRAIYTVRFGEALYVLHAFQKKSKTGIKTPAHVMATVRSRLKVAEADYLARRRKT